MLAAQRYYVFALAIFASLLSITFFFFRHDELVVNERIAKSPYRSSKPSLRDTITTLFDSIKHDPSVPSYRDPTGRFFVVNQTIWPKPLGKKILIVDIDTRVPTGENQILNPDTLDFENLDMHGGGLVSNAIINHYMYSIIHGYDYKFYQAQHIPDHHDTWIMPHVLRELIDEYDFVVAMDADVTIAHLDLPLEWMFNKWGIEKHTSMALPWDTEEKHGNLSISVDSKGLRVLNTGFVVAQNSNTTRDLLEKWRDCTSEERYPGCAEWKEKWSHEQRAFSEYIRYDYNNTPETIVSIPCDDAVGWPGFKKDAAGYNDALSDCNGNFVRHYTLGKDQAKTASSFGVMQLLGQVLQRNLLKEQERVWVKEAEKSREGELEGENEGPKGMQSEVKKQEKEEEKETSKDDAVPAILEGMVPATSG